MDLSTGTTGENIVQNTIAKSTIRGTAAVDVFKIDAPVDAYHEEKLQTGCAFGVKHR